MDSFRFRRIKFTWNPATGLVRRRPSLPANGGCCATRWTPTDRETIRFRQELLLSLPPIRRNRSTALECPSFVAVAGSAIPVAPSAAGVSDRPGAAAIRFRRKDRSERMADAVEQRGGSTGWRCGLRMRRNRKPTGGGGGAGRSGPDAGRGG